MKKGNERGRAKNPSCYKKVLILDLSHQVKHRKSLHRDYSLILSIHSVRFSLRTETSITLQLQDQKMIRQGFTGWGALMTNGQNQNLLLLIDIHYSQLINGVYTFPENIGKPINTEYIEGDLCLSPDERYIIVAC